MTFPQDGYLLAAADGDAWWFLDERMTVKVSSRESGGAFTLIEFSGPRGFGPPRHVHEREDELFYVFDGEMRVVCGAKDWQVSSGSLVFLPHAIEHAYIITSETPIRALQLTSPGGFEDFLSELGRRPDGVGLPQPQAPDVARLNEVAGRQGRRLVGPPLTL
jgi:quercetin dioxygenase-like cupin family protein